MKLPILNIDGSKGNTQEVSDKLIKLKVEDIPSLPRHAKLRFDNARKKWIINAPERVFELDDIAGEVMQLINGKDTLKQIIDKLLTKYENAPREQVTDDVIVMLQS